MNHTPGEWIVSKLKYPCEVDIVYVETDNELVICAVDGFVIGPEEALANARLIAAAPALLEACQGLVNNLPDCAINWARDCIGNTNAAVIIHWRDKTKAAIRLATEETK